MLTVDQVLAVQKDNVETLFGLSAKAFSGVEKFVELNLAASKAAIIENADKAQAALNVKDAQELLALQASFLQPLAEKSLAYGRHVYDIAASTGSEFNATYETQAAAAQQKYAEFVDSVAKNAPAGSENAVAVFKSAMTAAGNAYESAQKAFKQAQSLAEQNINALSSSAAQTVAQAAGSAKTSKKR